MNPYKKRKSHFSYMQEGGMPMEQQAPVDPSMAQQAEPDAAQQVMQAIIEMLQQGASPEQVVEQLVQMGLSQDQATQAVQLVMQQAQVGQQMRMGGFYRSK